MNSGPLGVVVATTGQPTSPILIPPPPLSAKSTIATTSTSSSSSASATAIETISSSHFNPNSVEILVDNSNFVDIRQQDSGSNQSGSDSGLGHTNSVSSDNSTFTTVVQDHLSLNNNNCNNNSTYSSSNKQGVAGSSSTCTRNNKLSSINESRTILDSATYKQSSSAVAFKSQDIKKLDESAVKPVEARNGLVVQSSQQQQNVPVLKSLLKKPSRFVQNDSTTAISHKRHVSFNQTVIVFCEEIEAPSPSDHFEPPLAYQDSSTAFNNSEPPRDYRDHKTVDNCREETSSRVDSSLDGPYDDESNGDGLAKALGTDSASNLTDDQLLGLLEDELLLESFKLNCDDFSEDEFPVNYLNSNHSYLCNEAISDYDSDSQSSLCVDSRGIQPLGTSVGATTDILGKTKFIESKSTTDIEQTRSTCTNDIPETQKIKFSDEIKKPPESRIIEHNNSVKSSRAHKTMPARMKVSTLDNIHPKRRSHQDHDLKARIEPSKNMEFQDDKQTTVNQEATSAGTLLITQSTIEPITLSKFKIVPSSKSAQADQVQNTNDRTGDDLVCGTSLRTFNNPKPIDDDCTRVRDIVSSSIGQEPRLNLTSTNLNHRVQTSHTQNESVCHICRAIESDRSHVNTDSRNLKSRVEFSKQMNSDNNNNNHQESYISLRQIRAVQNTVTSKPTDLSNQSCASCRELSTKQHNATTQNVPAQSFSTDIAQQPRPLACQLVYVVDRNGNRVRALSVIRPPNQNSAVSGQTVLTGQRVFIAQNGMRFPCPVSVVRPVNFSTNSANNATNWENHNLTNDNSTNQYRILGNAQTLPPTQMQQRQFVTTQAGIRTTAPPTSFRTPMEGLGMRPHTVYYLRQPLGMQNIRQSFDSSSTNSRSFPDPHEIRRLDGLRGPTAALQLTQRVDQAGTSIKNLSAMNKEANAMFSSEAPRRLPDSIKGEMEDPTFGFSKRPSVKVVATNNLLNTIDVSSKASNICCASATTQEQCLPYTNQLNVRRTHMIDQAGVVKPISVVVLGSQTLDRRNLNQQHAQSIKENLLSTSSMSNIHGTLTSIKQSESGNESCHQLRILAENSIPPNNPKFKETKENEINYDGLDSNKRISNNRISSEPSFKGRKISNLNENKNTLPNKQRSSTKESGIAYSMNI